MSDNILGKRMRWLRERRELQQKVVADSLGLSTFQLSRYESGKNKPDPELIVRISDFYEVNTDYLLGKSDHPKLDQSRNIEVDEEVEELLKILEGMSEETRKEMEIRILAYAKGLADANKD